MFSKMCMTLACKNMYVTIVHGRANAAYGANSSASVTPGIVCWTKYIPMFAISRFLTQRVMRGSSSPLQYISTATPIRRAMRVIGSSPAARRAGSQQATAAIAQKSRATATNVAGSVGATPTSMLRITRVSANADARPSAIPDMLSRIPWPMTSRKMSCFDEPSAIRTPISAVRCRTTVESTPYRPTPESRTAIPAKIPMRISANLVGASATLTYADIGFMSATGTSGSTDATAAFAAAANSAGSPVRADHPAVRRREPELAVEHIDGLTAVGRQPLMALMLHDADDVHPFRIVAARPHEDPFSNGTLTGKCFRGEQIVDHDVGAGRDIVGVDVKSRPSRMRVRITSK